jgi:hypothetical protein
LTEDAKLIAEKARLEAITQSAGAIAAELGAGFLFKVSTERIRRLMQLYTLGDSDPTHFGSREAESFLHLFRATLEERLNGALQHFVKERLQK